MIGINSVQVYTHSKYSETGCVNVNARFNLSLVFKTRQDNLAKVPRRVILKLRYAANSDNGNTWEDEGIPQCYREGSI